MLYEEKCRRVVLSLHIHSDTFFFWLKFWDLHLQEVNGKGGATGGPHKRVVVKHCDIIKDNFWEAHPGILNKKVRKYHSVFMLVFILLVFTVINCWCSWFIRNI